jgi:uncharacterized protein (TIGR02145 family)
MKQFYLIPLLLVILSANAQVGIGTETPHPSAKLEVSSSSQGLLPPRMTEEQRDLISTPAQGLMVYCSNCGTNGELQVFNGDAWTNLVGGAAAQPPYPAGSVFCASGPTAIVEVTNPSTGMIWMDRNLGAIQVATSSTDVNSYGDLYQWGRRSDGHQCRNSAITTTLSSTDQPPGGDFIRIGISPNDWRSPQNTNLWQGVNGVNNPCPRGYRLPTEAEWNDERLSWVQAPINSTNNSAGAFASPLKLPIAGEREFSNGSLTFVGARARYWSSTVSGASSLLLEIGPNTDLSVPRPRAYGFSVRCIKD